jgi:predicted tellurium resistance membrane protein TerC
MIDLMQQFTWWSGILGEVAVDAETVTQVANAAEETLFSIQGVFTLGMLILLQAVLGFDNLLYISIESKRVEASEQSKVRKLGIGLAIFFRIGLLFVVVNLVKALDESFYDIESKFISANVSGHSLIVLAGGAFILWTALKEIYHLLSVHDLVHEGEHGARNSVGKAIALIVTMNLVFSFDSILSAMALTESLVIMATAIVISGLMMIWLADHVAEFLKRNRMYEVLGLFVLFIVGVMLVSEGGHKANLQLFGHHVHAMAKSTFYFVLAVLVVVDVVQARFQKKLLAQRAAAQQAA